MPITVLAVGRRCRVFQCRESHKYGLLLIGAALFVAITNTNPISPRDASTDLAVTARNNQNHMASKREAMLSLEKCRSLLGPNFQLQDSQIEQLRQELYALAHIALDAFRESNQPARNDKSQLSHIPLEGREEVEERAAIFEFDAGINREVAERKALDGLSRRPRKRR